MDKRCLLLLLGLSLLLGFLQALRCHQCFRVRPDGSCQHRRAICTAKENEECLQRKYYNDNRYLHGYQDCRANCTNMTAVQGTYTMVLSCCKDRNFCNRM
uniref:UPAR/Ly6 domain-containing protein n=1 Tax=Loxodonta africana TaxID=9785 RepID=G3UDG7_LOXAF